MADEVLVSKENGTLIVTINRPEAKNAVNKAVAVGIAAAMDELDGDASLRVGILTGAGGTFCAGMDLKAFVTGETPEVEGRGFAGITARPPQKPLIAAVEGYAVAGGLELAAWCDLRVAAEDAVFGVYCRRWGIPLMDGGTIRLARLIGHSHALDLILTGRGVSGEEALRLGLANRLVPSGTALEHAIELARDIASRPQAALRSDRLSSYEQWSLSLADALMGEYHHGMATLNTGEMLGGLDDYATGGWRDARQK